MGTPKAAHQRSKIGIWSGASPAKKSDIKRGLKRLNDLGIDEISFIEKNILQASKSESKKRPFLAGSDSIKVQALLKLLANPELRDILCVRGGYGSQRLLSLLSKVKFKKTNTEKLLWGFSDMTSLQNYLFLKAGLSWVHSPMLTSEAFIQPEATEAKFWHASSPSLLTQHKVTLLKGAVSFKKNPPPTTVMGGNLTCLTSLVTSKLTPYPTKNFFLFLEEISERGYRIDRMLTVLHQSGFLNRCAGIFLGYFTECHGWQGVFSAFSKDSSIPIYWGIKAGHNRPNLPLVLGKKINVRAVRKNFGTLELEFPNLQIGC